MTPPRRSGPKSCRRKFLKLFPGGFHDETYRDWERDYKWATHKRWTAALGESEFRHLLQAEDYREITTRAVRVEQQSRHSMIFSFEKMALRDAVKAEGGAERFARGLYDFLYGTGTPEDRFTAWIETVASLPRRQTRVLTWPLVTVFGFVAKPRVHMFLKPTVTRRAAEEYGFQFEYESRPNWRTYRSLLDFARQVRADTQDLRPRDLIDIQSFMWVQGSSEYD
jgi:hypothetical protein